MISSISATIRFSSFLKKCWNSFRDLKRESFKERFFNTGSIISRDKRMRSMYSDHSQKENPEEKFSSIKNSFYENVSGRLRNKKRLTRQDKKQLQERFATPCSSLTYNNCFCQDSKSKIKARCTSTVILEQQTRSKICKDKISKVEGWIVDKKESGIHSCGKEKIISFFFSIYVNFFFKYSVGSGESCHHVSSKAKCSGNIEENIQYLSLRMQCIQSDDDFIECCPCKKSYSSIEEVIPCNKEMQFKCQCMDGITQTKVATIEQDCQTLCCAGCECSTQTFETRTKDASCSCENECDKEEKHIEINLCSNKRARCNCNVESCPSKKSDVHTKQKTNVCCPCRRKATVCCPCKNKDRIKEYSCKKNNFSDGLNLKQPNSESDLEYTCSKCKVKMSNNQNEDKSRCAKNFQVQTFVTTINSDLDKNIAIRPTMYKCNDKITSCNLDDFQFDPYHLLTKVMVPVKKLNKQQPKLIGVNDDVNFLQLAAEGAIQSSDLEHKQILDAVFKAVLNCRSQINIAGIANKTFKKNNYEEYLTESINKETSTESLLINSQNVCLENYQVQPKYSKMVFNNITLEKKLQNFQKKLPNNFIFETKKVSKYDIHDNSSEYENRNEIITNENYPIHLEQKQFKSNFSNKIQNKNPFIYDDILEDLPNNETFNNTNQERNNSVFTTKENEQIITNINESIEVPFCACSKIDVTDSNLFKFNVDNLNIEEKNTLIKYSNPFLEKNESKPIEDESFPNLINYIVENKNTKLKENTTVCDNNSRYHQISRALSPQVFTLLQNNNLTNYSKDSFSTTNDQLQITTSTPTSSVITQKDCPKNFTSHSFNEQFSKTTDYENLPLRSPRNCKISQKQPIVSQTGLLSAVPDLKKRKSQMPKKKKRLEKNSEKIRKGIQQHKSLTDETSNNPFFCDINSFASGLSFDHISEVKSAGTDALNLKNIFEDVNVQNTGTDALSLKSILEIPNIQHMGTDVLDLNNILENIDVQTEQFLRSFNFTQTDSYVNSKLSNRALKHVSQQKNLKEKRKTSVRESILSKFCIPTSKESDEGKTTPGSTPSRSEQALTRKRGNPIFKAKEKRYKK